MPSSAPPKCLEVLTGASGRLATGSHVPVQHSRSSPPPERYAWTATTGRCAARQTPSVVVMRVRGPSIDSVAHRSTSSAKSAARRETRARVRSHSTGTRLLSTAKASPATTLLRSLRARQGTTRARASCRLMMSRRALVPTRSMDSRRLATHVRNRGKRAITPASARQSYSPSEHQHVREASRPQRGTKGRA